MDFDPDGIAIMSTYKHGSISLSHENTNLVVPGVQWLGIRSGDIMRPQYSSPGTLKTTSRDRRIAIKMLGSEVISSGEEWEWRAELQAMLMLNVKAEIQSLGGPEALTMWLDLKLLGALS